MPDAGEECDDGNKLDLDSCSSSCKSACDTCLDEFYGEDAEYVGFRDLCTKTTMLAENGPAAGTPRNELCLAAVKCFRNSGCAASSAETGGAGLFLNCYCASGQSQADCVDGGPEGKGNPQGPCVKEVENAAESKTPAEIAVLFSNITVAIGPADALVRTEAYAGYCAETCSFGIPVDDCTRCAAGEMHDFGMSLAVCPAGFTVTGLSVPLSRCVREKCTAANFETCLAAGGPCAAELTDVAPPAVDYTKQDLACRATHCAAECFKP